MKMIHLALKTGYSFREVFGHIETVLNYKQDGYIGIADTGNTFSQYDIEMECKKDDSIKPIYAVRLNVVEHGAQKIKPRGQFGPEYIFIAKNSEGLKEIYNLVKINYENFYYRGQISLRDLNSLTENVIVIAENIEFTDRIDYIALTTTTPNYMYKLGIKENIPFVSIVNNFYPEKNDFDVYQLFVGERNSCMQTYPQHILSTDEWSSFQYEKARDKEHLDQAIQNTHLIAQSCEKIELPKAPMIKYNGKLKIGYLCKIGAANKKINIVSGEYADRYNYEMELIKDRGFDDYFIIVADMISKAKSKMLVGPARGSSAGSLVCYLMGITEVDPLKFDLMFERFIDINRMDLPDIDIDFPDIKRDGVIKQLVKDYGADYVKKIANISRLKPRSAIGNFAKVLYVDQSQTEELKDCIIERSAGDERKDNCIEDTFKTNEIAKSFLEKFPNMKLCERIEGHPDHSSTHAAGIIVCNDPVHFYAGVNARDDTVMCNKHSSEYQNLLKIDVLGLRTLSVLGDCSKMIKMDHNDYYTLPLDDQKTFQLMTSGRLDGVFQFEGQALRGLTSEMGVKNFEDIVAITSLARPASLYSGSAARYVKYRLGQDSPIYLGELHEKITCKTFGIVVFQEQILMICREIGLMSWEDVNALRKALSKSLGDDYFAKYKDKFIQGAIKNNYNENDSNFIWGEVRHGGNYAFNRCLSGDTMVRIASPNQHLNKFVSIQELYKKYVESPNAQIINKKQLPNLVSLFPDGVCKPQRMKNIFKNGEKQCIKYTLENGHFFECTNNHKFIINGCWSEIGSSKIGDTIKICNDEYKNIPVLKGISGKGKIGTDSTFQEGFANGENNPAYINGKTQAENDFIEENQGEFCDICFGHCERMEAHHNDFNSGYDRPFDLSWLCSSCHKIEHYKNGRTKAWEKGKSTSLLKIISIENAGVKMTYDIEMPIHHNYVIEGGAITHNSHAVSYAMVSYWTAYMKTHHPLEFLVSCLNNEKDEESSVKLLRDSVENDGIQYTAIDPDHSDLYWTVKGDKIIGGLTSLKGIGVTKARKMIKCRNGEEKWSKGLANALINPKTIFSNLYPCDRYFGEIYNDPRKYDLTKSPVYIKDISTKGTHTFIGRLRIKKIKDLNDFENLQKRGGKFYKNNTLELILTLEDDTGDIMGKIDRFAYDEFIDHLDRYGEIDESWFMVKGEIWSNEIRFLNIKNIMFLNKNEYGYIPVDAYGEKI